MSDLDEHHDILGAGSSVTDNAEAQHPLDQLSAAEIRGTTRTIREAHPELEAPAFAVVALAEPVKQSVVEFKPGDPLDRRAHAVVLDRATGATYEATVLLDGFEVESWRLVPGVQPPIMLEDFAVADETVRADPRFIEALRRRGIGEMDDVQVDPLAAGWFPHYPAGRRVVWAVPYLRGGLERNAYARPIENLRALVDIATAEVLEVIDGDAVPVPTADGDYDEQAVGGFRDDVKPLEIVQPEGTSFDVSGNVIRWQRWAVHVGLHPVEGLVLSDLRYEGRQVLYRASISEMVVPYGDPHDGYYWRSYFDAGEYGLGRMTGSLELGCDCLGEIRYLDAELANAAGEPETIVNAICLHEEDHGILWKHRNPNTGASDVRRSRRMVVSSIATVGNYDYGFYWYLYQDGSIEFEVKLTGIVLTRGLPVGEPARHGNRLAPDLAAPHHQHLFCARLDMAVDGFDNTVYELDMVAADDDPANPYGGAMEVVSSRIERERDGRRSIDPLRARSWKIVNERRLNAVGEAVGYKLVPHPGPVLLARPDSSVGRRAGFAQSHLWVTRFAPDQFRAAGDYPNQSPGGEGLPQWVRVDRELVDADVVLWHTFGTSHAARPEDWPVMPVERVGFSLKPAGFFDRNPGIDVPPSHRAECAHTEE